MISFGTFEFLIYYFWLYIASQKKAAGAATVFVFDVFGL
jgi:hypothetical protein